LILEEFAGGVGFSVEFEFGVSSIDRWTVREDNSIVGGLVDVGIKGFSHNHRLSFDDNKVLKLSIGYAKHLFKCA